MRRVVVEEAAATVVASEVDKLGSRHARKIRRQAARDRARTCADTEAVSLASGSRQLRVDNAPIREHAAIRNLMPTSRQNEGSWSARKT